MKVLAAFQLAILGGNAHPKREDVVDILAAVGIGLSRDEDHALEHLIVEVERIGADAALANGFATLNAATTQCAELETDQFGEKLVVLRPGLDPIVTLLTPDGFRPLEPDAQAPLDCSLSPAGRTPAAGDSIDPNNWIPLDESSGIACTTRVTLGAEGALQLPVLPEQVRTG